MPRLRHLTALALTALAFGAAACGDDEESTEGGGGAQTEAPLRDEGTNDPAEGLPAPEDGGQDEGGG